MKKHPSSPDCHKNKLLIYIHIISDRSDQIIKQSVSQKLQNKTIFESCSSLAPDGKPRHTVHAVKIPAA